jgi:hypothetical protein
MNKETGSLSLVERAGSGQLRSNFLERNILPHDGDNVAGGPNGLDVIHLEKSLKNEKSQIGIATRLACSVP